MKELVKKTTYIEELDIEVKQYLSNSEIELIVTNLVAIEDLFERELMKDFYLLKFCTNIDEKELEEIDIDLMIESGAMDTIELHIDNLYKIDEHLAKLESTTAVIKSFLVSLESKIPDAKTQKAMINKLSKLTPMVTGNDK